MTRSYYLTPTQIRTCREMVRCGTIFPDRRWRYNTLWSLVRLNLAERTKLGEFIPTIATYTALAMAQPEGR